MSGIEIYVKDEKEKAKLIEDYLAPDNEYLRALDALRDEMIRQGADLESKEGKKKFILAVRELNAKIGVQCQEQRSPRDSCKSCGG